MNNNNNNELNRLFKIYNHALIPNVPPHVFKAPLKSTLIKTIVRKKALFARYTSGVQLITPPTQDFNDNKGGITANKKDDVGHPIEESLKSHEWWYCLRNTPISLESLTAKQRYRVKKGLKNNTIHKTDIDEISRRYDELYDAIVASFSDYPDAYRPQLNKESTRKDIIHLISNNNIDVWLCEDINTGKIIGYCWCSISYNMVNLSAVKINPAYLKNEINAALGFVLCQYYLNEKGYKYICDGERNIRHQSNYQNFLVTVLGFHKAYCQLHVVYHPLIKPIISILYPFRNVLSRIKDNNSILYNIYCILMQEQYARASKRK